MPWSQRGSEYQEGFVTRAGHRVSRTFWCPALCWAGCQVTRAPCLLQLNAFHRVVRYVKNKKKISSPECGSIFQWAFDDFFNWCLLMRPRYKSKNTAGNRTKLHLTHQEIQLHSRKEREVPRRTRISGDATSFLVKGGCPGHWMLMPPQAWKALKTERMWE